MSGVRVRLGPSCAVSEVRCMSPRSNAAQAECPAWDRGPRLCIEPLRRDTRMTLGDWVALAMLWWKGGGRPAIVRWLVEPRRAGRMGRGVARRSKRSSLPSTPVLRRRVGWPGPARRPRVRSRPRTQAASPPSPGPTPATRRRWPRSQTRPRSCGSAAIRRRSGHPRLRSLAPAPAPRMPAMWAGSWDLDWRDAASQWSADWPGASTRPRIEVRWLLTGARLVYWALVWTSCTLPSTVGWRVM